MGKILSVNRNSKESFLGGGKGALIPLGPLPKKRSKMLSEDSEPVFHSQGLNEEIDQIAQEALEQWGGSPSETTEGSTSSTDGNS